MTRPGNQIGVVKNPAVTSDSKSWLASPHGTDPNAMPGFTVDTALFPAAAKADGYIPSGTLVSSTATEDIYGPYDAAAERHAILFQYIDTSNGDHQFMTAGLVHGFVFGRKLPGGAAAVAAIAASLPMIYVY